MKFTQNKSTIKSLYRPEINGLKAFAIVAVIINHFNKEILPNGYLGIDIFFVISGFVITSSLYQRPSKNFEDFISGFYERRIKRLLPALSFFVLIMSIAICLFNPKPIINLRTGLTSLFGLSNLYLLQYSQDYFAKLTELNVFAHTWSLGVGEQFYILFPYIIWFSGFGRQTKNGTRNLFLTVGGLGIVSFIGFLYLYPINQEAAFLQMQTRFWEMASGCLLFICCQKVKSFEHFLEKVEPLFVLALILGVMYFPISWATASRVAVILLSSVLIACLQKQRRAYKFFTHPKVVYIGDISYSLYLWHWGVLSISRWTIGIHWWSVPFQIVLILCLAITSYRYIETPVLKGEWLGERWKILILGGGVIVVLSSFLIALERPLKGKLYAGKKIISTNREDFTQLRLGKSSLTWEKCIGHKNFSSEQLKLLFSECKYPVIRQSRNQRTLAFVGDSQAISLLNAEETLTNSGFRVINYSYAGCPFPLPPFGIFPRECNKFLINAENKILQDLKAGDSIIIYNYHLSHLGGYNLKYTRHNIFNKNKNRVSDPSTKINLYMAGLNRLSKKAYEKSILIYIIGSAYRNNDMELTKEWFRPYDPALKTLLQEAGNAKKLNKILANSIKDGSFTNIIFVNPLEILDKSCGRNMNSYLECFRDNNHLSDKSAKELIDFLLINYWRP